MDIQNAKLSFVEEFLKLQDENIVKKIIATMQEEKSKASHSPLSSFAGSLSKEEAQVFIEASQECRKINENEW